MIRLRDALSLGPIIADLRPETISLASHYPSIGRPAKEPGVPLTGREHPDPLKPAQGFLVSGLYLLRIIWLGRICTLVVTRGAIWWKGEFKGLPNLGRKKKEDWSNQKGSRGAV